MDLGWKLL